MDKRKITKKKISIRQVMLMFFFTSVSGILRLATPESGKFFSKSSWLSPVFALLPVLLLIFILDRIIKKHNGESLAQIIETVFGKIVGKAVLFMFFVHVMFFTAFFLRNFGEKFVASIFPIVPPAFFMIIILLFALFAIRKNIESFARFSEFSFVIIAVVFVLMFFAALFNIKPTNIYPVTYYDTVDILKSSVPLISLWSLLTFSLFLGDNIRYSGKLGTDDTGGKFRRTATKFILIIALFNFLSLIAVIGVFNADTASNLSMPYYMIFKSIKAPGIIHGFETFFIILWTFTDFITIAFCMFVISKIFKPLFAVSVDNTKLFMFPLAFIIFMLAYIIGGNNFEADWFYTNILSYSSVILGFIFPFVLLVVGKIRRVL